MKVRHKEMELDLTTPNGRKLDLVTSESNAPLYKVTAKCRIILGSNTKLCSQAPCSSQCSPCTTWAFEWEVNFRSNGTHVAQTLCTKVVLYAFGATVCWSNRTLGTLKHVSECRREKNVLLKEVPFSNCGPDLLSATNVAVGEWTMVLLLWVISAVCLLEEFGAC